MDETYGGEDKPFKRFPCVPAGQHCPPSTLIAQNSSVIQLTTRRPPLADIRFSQPTDKSERALQDGRRFAKKILEPSENSLKQRAKYTTHPAL
jgi:hypothetical protein